MIFTHFIAFVAAVSLATAVAIKRQSESYESAVYWGSSEQERSLGDYCAADEGIDIIIVSFLANFGGGAYPNGYLGDCWVKPDGSTEGCDSVAADVKTCRANGKKVFLSIGGAGADWKLTSENDAKGVAYSLWNSYANPAVTDSVSPRPLGDAFFDGWDVDIESNPDGSSDRLADLVTALRSNFDQDSSNTYYISGAPQCPLNPIADMDGAIKNSQFDYLFIQFYNNNCAAADYINPDGDNPDGNGQYNFADWPAYLSGTASEGAKLHVGIPASTKGADSSYFYIPTYSLPDLVNHSKDVAGFNGIMLWDAGNSDIPQVDGCNYAQQVRRVLDTGSTC